MIVFLAVIYIVILLIMFKLKLVPNNTYTRLSPIAWVIFLFFALFIPMQFWAPGGRATVYQYSVAIVPNVAGQVIEVPVEPNVDLKKDDVLFRIDPIPYQAALDQVKAQLDLARVRVKETRALREQNAVSIYELEQYEAQVKQLEAAMESAAYNLEQTVVRAPADGFVTSLALRPGARAVSFPFSPAMSFVESSRRVLAAQIHQSHLRFVKPGQKVEVAFKLYPGKVFSGKVELVVRASAMGQVLPSGTAVAPREIKSGPFFVRLALDDEEAMSQLPAGAVADVAIYTTKGKPTHVIRKVMVRMTTYLNFVNPL